VLGEEAEDVESDFDREIDLSTLAILGSAIIWFDVDVELVGIVFLDTCVFAPGTGPLESNF